MHGWPVALQRAVTSLRAIDKPQARAPGCSHTESSKALKLRRSLLAWLTTVKPTRHPSGRLLGKSCGKVGQGRVQGQGHSLLQAQLAVRKAHVLLACPLQVTPRPLLRASSSTLHPCGQLWSASHRARPLLQPQPPTCIMHSSRVLLLNLSLLASAYLHTCNG